MKNSVLVSCLLLSIAFIDGMEKSLLQEAIWAQRIILLFKPVQKYSPDKSQNYFHLLAWHVKKNFLKKYMVPLCVKKPDALIAWLAEWARQDTVDADGKLSYFFTAGIDSSLLFLQEAELRVLRGEKLVSMSTGKSIKGKALYDAIIRKEQSRIRDIVVYSNTVSSQIVSSYFQLLPPHLRSYFLKRYFIPTYQKYTEHGLFHMRELLDNRDFIGLRALLEHGVELHTIHNPPDGLLHHAVTFPCFRATKLLLSHNANINGSDKTTKQSPLEVALRARNFINAVCLLEHGALIEKPACYLELAIINNGIHLLKLLLKKGAIPIVVGAFM